MRARALFPVSSQDVRQRCLWWATSCESCIYRKSRCQDQLSLFCMRKEFGTSLVTSLVCHTKTMKGMQRAVSLTAAALYAMKLYPVVIK